MSGDSININIWRYNSVFRKTLLKTLKNSLLLPKRTLLKLKIEGYRSRRN